MIPCMYILDKGMNYSHLQLLRNCLAQIAVWVVAGTKRFIIITVVWELESDFESCENSDEWKKDVGGEAQEVA